MVSSAKLVRGLKITGLWLLILLCTLAAAVGLLGFVLSAINDQPDGAVVTFILAAIAIKMIFWLLDPLVKLVETTPS
ncbi:MAG: hypothetical protein LAO08_06485 [Acidobacteriia bacterium]|nr:hypothetical protein [Terriglobia bacterium]